MRSGRSWFRRGQGVAFTACRRTPWSGPVRGPAGCCRERRLHTVHHLVGVEIAFGDFTDFVRELVEPFVVTGFRGRKIVEHRFDFVAVRIAVLESRRITVIDGPVRWCDRFQPIGFFCVCCHFQAFLRKFENSGASHDLIPCVPSAIIDFLTFFLLHPTYTQTV